MAALMPNATEGNRATRPVMLFCVLQLLAVSGLSAAELFQKILTSRAFDCEYIVSEREITRAAIEEFASKRGRECIAGKQLGRLLFATTAADLEVLSWNYHARAMPTYALRVVKSEEWVLKKPAAALWWYRGVQVLRIWDGRRLSTTQLAGTGPGMTIQGKGIPCEVLHIRLYRPPPWTSARDSIQHYLRCTRIPSEKELRRITEMIKDETGGRDTVVWARADPYFWLHGFPLNGSLIPGWTKPKWSGQFGLNGLRSCAAYLGRPIQCE
jgi:hypothetical protein